MYSYSYAFLIIAFCAIIGVTMLFNIDYIVIINTNWTINRQV
jgi:hypothetical protein